MISFDLTISIVTYNIDCSAFYKTVESIIKSCLTIIKKYKYYIHISIIDNSNLNNYSKKFDEIKNKIDLVSKPFNLIIDFKSFPENPGYAKSNNTSILTSNSKFHLILNPDVVLEESTLLKLIDYMEANPETDIVTPKVFDWIGEDILTTNQQFLLKRYPSVLQLFLRGFAPKLLRKLFSTTLSSYEYKDLDFSKTQINLEIVSGCFMFCRTESLKRVGGFDENFFLYFEDFDLSKRLSRKDYFPDAVIYHKGGNASKKGWLHRKLFIQSAYQFFQKHGWKWL